MRLRGEEVLELFQYVRIFRQEFFDLLESYGAEVPFETAHAADIGSEAGAADLFIDLVHQLTVLHYVQEACERAAVHPDHRVADQVVCDTRQLHDDHAQILHALRDLDFEEFLDSHVPADVIDRRGTIIQTVGDRRDLVIRTSFGEFFKCAMNVSDRRLRLHDDLAIHFQNVLKNSVRRRVRRSQVQEGVLLLLHVPEFLYRFVFSHLPNMLSFLSSRV